jgi:uncharacterized protein
VTTSVTVISARPDISTLDVPMDAWTEPFWAAAAAEKFLLPRCGSCQHFRWPPGPFCPVCHSQHVEWCSAGEGRVYSFTLVRGATTDASGQAQIFAPALIEFSAAGGVRIPAAIVDSPIDSICIGAAVAVNWSQAANAVVPVFRIV